MMRNVVFQLIFELVCEIEYLGDFLFREVHHF